MLPTVHAVTIKMDAVHVLPIQIVVGAVNQEELLLVNQDHLQDLLLELVELLMNFGNMEPVLLKYVVQDVIMVEFAFVVLVLALLVMEDQLVNLLDVMEFQDLVKRLMFVEIVVEMVLHVLDVMVLHLDQNMINVEFVEDLETLVSNFVIQKIVNHVLILKDVLGALRKEYVLRQLMPLKQGALKRNNSLQITNVKMEFNLEQKKLLH